MADIKLFHILNGEDILGDIIEESNDIYTLKNPCLIGLAAGENGAPQLSLQHLVLFSKQDVVEINKSHVVYAVTVDKQIETQYNQMFGNIITPDSKIVL